LGRQDQLKQVWLTDEDDKLFVQVAEDMKAQGIDVEPDSRRSKTPYSYTKVFRHLLKQAAAKSK
jgi:hypothetical protein